MRPPTIRVLTTQVTAGRPTIAIQVLDSGAGVDPYSLALSYGRVVIGAAAYDPFSGVALFPLPAAAPRIRTGRLGMTFLASDYQEAKNADVYGRDLMPNTRISAKRVRIVRRPTLTWLTPLPRRCVSGSVQLLVVASPPNTARAARFYDGKRRLRVLKRGVAGLYATTWRARGAKRGRHTLRAVVRVGGKRVEASRVVRVCK
jgi:hypothetical protein